MKKRAPTIIDRIRFGFRFGIKVFVILSTIATTIIGVISATGNFISLDIIFIVVGVCIISSLVASFIKGIGPHVPDFFYDDNESLDGQCTAELCDPKRLEEACEMTKKHYKQEYVPAERAEQWRLRNPKAFVDVIDRNGELISSFGIIALKEAFLDNFLKGLVADTQLNGDDVLNIKNSKKSNKIYISGVVVSEAGKSIGHRRAKMMVWAMLLYYKKYYGFKVNRELYAVAVNKESGSLLKNCGFKLIMPNKNRVDQGNLYKLDISYESWQKLLKRVGDFSEMCKINF